VHGAVCAGGHCDEELVAVEAVDVAFYRFSTFLRVITRYYSKCNLVVAYHISHDTQACCQLLRAQC